MRLRSGAAFLRNVPGWISGYGMRKQDGTQACFLAHGALLERKPDGNYLIAWTFFEVRDSVAEVFLSRCHRR